MWAESIDYVSGALIREIVSNAMLNAHYVKIRGESTEIWLYDGSFITLQETRKRYFQHMVSIHPIGMLPWVLVESMED